ncbi:MAG: endonuclease/exonuclease/phosphatase family protein [Planctomycetes bacterium]|nr:endonuclease/exonuclease/phosphatase family protein [Planctomycetota bacterium]
MQKQPSLNAPKYDCENMRTLLWNVEFGKSPLSVSYLHGLVSSRYYDVVCLTESTLDFLAGRGNVLRSIGDYGYDDHSGFHQKISLWSRQPWTEIDFEGDRNLPPGRFLSAVSFGVRFVGVCVPWSKAHVVTGSKSKAMWEDHVTYLKVLKQVLKRYEVAGQPICVLGDFNQAIPATAWNRKVFPVLMETLGEKFQVWTNGIVDENEKPLIDHVATSHNLRFTISEIIESKDPEGNRLSDHSGIIGTLSRMNNC